MPLNTVGSLVVICFNVTFQARDLFAVRLNYILLQYLQATLKAASTFDNTHEVVKY